MRRNLSGQNVVGIRCAEDPTEFANWGETGWYVPPLGTSISTGAKTLDNDSTPANNTPILPSFEIVEGNTMLNFPIDEDDKEASDVSGNLVKRDPGDQNLDISMEYNEERGTARLGTSARKYHPTNMEYRRGIDYVRYESFLITHPRDTSGNALPVKPGMDKTTIKGADEVFYFIDATYHNKSPSLEPGDKARSSLAGHFENRRHYLNYTFDVELLADGAVTVGSYSLDTQPKLPTRLKLVVTSWSAGGASPNHLILVGKDIRGNAITENVETLTANGTYYSTKVYDLIDTNGVQVQGTMSLNLEITAAELR